MDATNRKQLWRKLGFALKLIITGLILWGIFRKLDLYQVWQNLISQPPWLVFSILGVAVLRHGAQLLAWQLSLQVSPLYKLNRIEVFNSYMIGQALRFAIPGSFGMLGKLAYVQNSSPSAKFISYALERIFVNWSIYILASLSLLFLPQGISAWIRWLLFIFLATLPVWLYLLLLLNRKWQALRASYLKFVPGISLLVLASGFLHLFQYWLLLHLTEVISFWEVFKRMAISHISYSIPITVAGLGLKESFAISLFSKTNLLPEKIASTTLAIFIINDVLPALIGAGIFLRVKETRWVQDESS